MEKRLYPLPKQLPSVGLSLWALATLLSTGCVERTLYVKSDPPGAQVTLNHAPMGQTPLTHNFYYYGTVRLRLEKEGFEPLETQERIKSPWFDVFPWTLLFELIPVTFTVERTMTYSLRKGETVKPQLP